MGPLLAENPNHFLKSFLSVLLLLRFLGLEINPVGVWGSLDYCHVSVLDEHLCDLVCRQIFDKLDLEDKIREEFLVLYLFLREFKFLH